MRQLLTLLAVAFLLPMLMGFNADAQSTATHPRAIELEKMMQGDLQGVIRDMLPKKPFRLSVKVIPLRREAAKNAGREELPYYETNEEIRDEWDDPAKSNYELLTRVTRITVKVTLPKGLTDTEISDVKAAVFSTLPLNDVRDVVEIETKDFPDMKPPETGPSTFMITAFSTVCALLLAFGLVAFFNSRRLAKAIQTIKIQPSDAGASGGGLPAPSMPANFDRNERGGGAGGLSEAQDVQFQDTLKMLEIIGGLLKTIHASPAFPTLEDMILFEKFSEEYPASTGALFAEFPVAVRNKVFSLTSSAHWLKTLTEPGKVDSSSFALVSRLARIDRESKNPKWEQLLVACWRMGDGLGGFLRKIDSKDAVVILKFLPQSQALKVARETMPGEWALILKNSKDAPFANEKIDGYLKTLAAENPPRATDVLEQYKRDVELMQFLRTADPQVEKEVYGALPASSSLFLLRPPFSRVLEAEAGKLGEFVATVPIEDWALSLLNVNKNQRQQVESCFTERQRFRFVELLRNYDRSGVSPVMVGKTRERIAVQYQATLPKPGSEPIPLRPNTEAKKAA